MNTKTEAAFNWIFQSNSLRKEEKQRFANLIEEILNGFGFVKVTKIFGGERKYSQAVRFEKIVAETTGQWIEFVFERYGQRKFYVTMGISETFSPNKHLLVGHVVRRKNENQYWWGSQWYSIFRKRAWIKATRRVAKYLPKLISYLDEVKTGDDIHHYVVLGS